MALIFVTAGVISLFPVVRRPPAKLELLFSKFPPKTLALSMVTLGYPIWGIFGGLMGLIYMISLERVPGMGLGSPNMAYTITVIVVALLVGTPFLFLLKRVWPGILTIILAFIGVFGWFLPNFAS